MSLAITSATPHDLPAAYRTTERDGKPAVEFSWEGGDGADGTLLTGRAWAVLDDGKLYGMFFIHQGDESGYEEMKK